MININIYIYTIRHRFQISPKAGFGNSLNWIMLEPCCRSTGKLFQLYSINGNAKRFNYYPHIKSLGDELNHNTAGFSWRACSAQSPRRNPGQIPKPPQLALTVSPSWIVELFILPLRENPDSLLEKSTCICNSILFAWLGLCPQVRAGMQGDQ